jgi:capsular polysaccharide biosynthesis protein
MVRDPWQSAELGVEAGDDVTERLLEYQDFSVTEERSGDPVSGLVDVGFIIAALRRSKRIWCLTAAAGLLIGSALFLHTHPSYQASVALLMSEEPGVDSYTALQTDAIIAQEPAVAATALKKLGLREPASNLLHAYTATIASNQVLAIAVIAPTQQLAVGEANALGAAFLEVRSGILTSQQRSTATAEKQELAQAQQTYNSIQDQITQLTRQRSSASEQKKLSHLQGKLTEEGNLLQAVTSNQATSELALTTEIVNSKILYASPAVRVHSRKTLAEQYVGGSLFGGLVLGFGIVITRAIVSDRPRRRDDVADALGAPVVLSVASSGRKKWLDIGSGAARRNLDVQRVAASLQSCISISPQRAASLLVVAVDDARLAASAVAECAISGARDGSRVIVADLAGGYLAQLLGVRSAGVSVVQLSGCHLVVALPDSGAVNPMIGPLPLERVGASSGAELAAAWSAADVLITLATLDPAVGADHLRTWASVAVATVTVGRSSVLKVRTAGELIRSADIDLLYAVLMGADKNDESPGLMSVQQR